jgi:hypothetical protein
MVDFEHLRIHAHSLVVGHIDCLSYLIENGCPLEDIAMSGAVHGGHLKAVEMLVSCGLPDDPFFLDRQTPYFGRFIPNQLRCLEHLLDNGRRIYPAVLIWAAIGGDVDGVRFLHSRGVPLWDSACVEDTKDRDFRDPARKKFLEYHTVLLARSILAVPEMPQDAEDMWKALYYGWAMGAPLTPVMEDFFEGKRAATRVTLFCFHVATGLSQDDGASCEQTAQAARHGARANGAHRENPRGRRVRDC